MTNERYIYKAKAKILDCELKETEGYSCSDGHKFVIEASLLTGLVTAFDDKIVKNVKMSLDSKDGAEIATALTDEGGRYYFEDVYPGIYIIVPHELDTNLKLNALFKPT